MSQHIEDRAQIEAGSSRRRADFNSTERLQFLIELLTDYYWELDTEGRFTTILHGSAKEWEHTAAHLLGKARWEVPGEPLQGTWQDHKATIESRAAFDGFVVERPDSEGTLRYFESRGRPRFAPDGTYLGHTGVTREVTREVREAKLSELDKELTRLLIHDSSAKGMSLALDLVVACQGWNSGKYWQFDSERAKASVIARAAADNESSARMPSAKKESDRFRSEQIIRSAIRANAGIHIEDFRTLSDGGPDQLERCAIVIPVILKGIPIGAIEFRSIRLDRLDQNLKNLLVRLSVQFAHIYEREYAIQKMQESEARYSSTVELAAIGISHVGLDGRFIHVNRHLVDMLGYSETEFREKTVRDISHADDQGVTDTMIERLTAREIGSFTAEKRYVSKDGETVWVRINSTMKWDADGNPMYHISTIENISDRKKAEERVAFLATHDDLTLLPSRAFFDELLARSIRSAKRKENGFAILFIDLDRFKIINDSLGHKAGDALLREVAGRISGCVRSCDCVARHGGDEFIVMLEGTDSSEDASIVARKILETIHAPMVLDGHECRITVSVGIAVYPDHGNEGTALVRNADVAMYAAKQNGKNCFEVFSSDLAPMSLERLSLERHLQQALERDEFRVLYQPKVDAKTGEMRGVEALLRWWNHELGTITPAQFIPVAEDTGLIVPIGKWVLNAACEQMADWIESGLPKITMSVNLSPRQFSHPDLLNDVREVLEKTRVSPELLELEITESMLVSNIDRAIKIASELQNLGIRLAIDDFGTGYSSLVQLKRFPVDTLKIDRSFIRDLPGSTEDMAITEAVIAMGKTLGVSVVAEGVETEIQRDFLAENACDQLQGYLFGRPCHADAIKEALLNRGRGDTGMFLALPKVSDEAT